MAWNEKLERAASEGKPLPDGLTFIEKTTYIAMRDLYRQYRGNLISREQAKKEKADLIKDFNALESRMRAVEESIKAWRWVDLSLNQCKCPECAALKRAIREMENCF